MLLRGSAQLGEVPSGPPSWATLGQVSEAQKQLQPQRGRLPGAQGAPTSAAAPMKCPLNTHTPSPERAQASPSSAAFHLCDTGEFWARKHRSGVK